MPRRNEDAPARLRARLPAGIGVRDPIVRMLHHLANNLHSLSLRMFVLQQSGLGTDAGSHVDAAHRLSQHSLRLIEEISRLVQIERAAAPPRVATRSASGARRSPRK
jgi:hypothetical protein